MSTYTTTGAPNLLATLWGPLEQIVTPLLDEPAPAVTDPGIPELLAALGAALTAAVHVTRTAPAAPAPVAARPAVVRAPAARVTTAQVGSVAGEPKPGSLRARLIAFLVERPGQQFTATELFHALGASSGGAVGAALNTMTAHGEAILTSDAPKRYAAPTTITMPAPASATSPTAESDPQDEPDQDETPIQTADTEHEAEAEGAPAAEANGDAPQRDTPAENATAPGAPQAADAPAPRATRGRKPKS